MEIFIKVVIDIFIFWLICMLISMAYLSIKKDKLYDRYKKSCDMCRDMGFKLVDDMEKYEDYIEDLGLAQTYRCTSSVVSNASNNSIKYLIKYSNIDNSKEELEKLELCMNFLKLHSKFLKKMDDLKNEVKSQIPLFVKIFSLKKRIPYIVSNIEWNLHKVNIYNFQFLYVSPAGKSSKSYTISITDEVLKKIQNEIYKKVDKKGHSRTQRSVMTNDLREAIKQRDNYTCCNCGNSVFKEPNLLLEVDHIIPISKGGKTEASNLQTLCWRCNREKSNK